MISHGITLPEMNVVNENIEEEIEQEKKEELEKINMSKT